MINFSKSQYDLSDQTCNLLWNMIAMNGQPQKAFGFRYFTQELYFKVEKKVS